MASILLSACFHNPRTTVLSVEGKLAACDLLLSETRLPDLRLDRQKECLSHDASLATDDEKYRGNNAEIDYCAREEDDFFLRSKNCFSIRRKMRTMTRMKCVLSQSYSQEVFKSQPELINQHYVMTVVNIARLSLLFLIHSALRACALMGP